ncbi:hypothetical protein BC940DRAFT_321478 [Gongronella butleri]|nr:hypothetical protein BC940DRAFT_321478 [Gongronella butleri]
MTEYMVIYTDPVYDPIYPVIDPIDFLFETKSVDPLMHEYNQDGRNTSTFSSQSARTPWATPMTAQTDVSDHNSNYFSTRDPSMMMAAGMAPPTHMQMTPNPSATRKTRSLTASSGDTITASTSAAPHAAAGARIAGAGNEAIDQMQDTLDFLQDEWASIDIVLRSVKSAFTVYPDRLNDDQYLDDVDRELSVAYDDLRAQVRSLDRNLKHLDGKIKAVHHPGQGNLRP